MGLKQVNGNNEIDYTQFVNGNNGVVYEDDSLQLGYVEEGNRYDKDLGNYNSKQIQNAYDGLVERLNNIDNHLKENDDRLDEIYGKLDKINKKIIQINDYLDYIDECLSDASLIRQVSRLIFPVGAIYTTISSSFDPHKAGFRGKWEKIAEGRCLFGKDGEKIKDIGGHYELQRHAHGIDGRSLTNSQDPALDNIQKIGLVGLNGNYVEISALPDKTILDTVDETKNNYRVPTIQKDGTGTSKFGPRTIGSANCHVNLSHEHTFSTTATEWQGGGDSGNLPPYIGVYFWKRIS